MSILIEMLSVVVDGGFQGIVEQLLLEGVLNHDCEKPPWSVSAYR